MKSGLWGALSSPTGWILAGGVVYVGYRLWDEIQKTKRRNLDPVLDEATRVGTSVLGATANLLEGSNPKITPRSDPIAPADPNGALAPIVAGPVNGMLAWDWRVTVQVNNTGPERIIELKVKADYVSPLLPKSSEVTAGMVKVPTGKKLFDVDVARPTLLSEVAYDAYFQTYVDGKLAGPHKFFSP